MLALAMAPFMPHIADKKWLSRTLWGLPLLIGSSFFILGGLGLVDTGPVAKLNQRYEVDGSGLFLATGLADNTVRIVSLDPAVSYLFFGYIF